MSGRIADAAIVLGGAAVLCPAKLGIVDAGSMGLTEQGCVDPRQG